MYLPSQFLNIYKFLAYTQCGEVLHRLTTEDAARVMFFFSPIFTTSLQPNDKAPQHVPCVGQMTVPSL